MRKGPSHKLCLCPLPSCVREVGQAAFPQYLTRKPKNARLQGSLLESSTVTGCVSRNSGIHSAPHAATTGKEFYRLDDMGIDISTVPWMTNIPISSCFWHTCSKAGSLLGSPSLLSFQCPSENNHPKVVTHFTLFL